MAGRLSEKEHDIVATLLCEGVGLRTIERSFGMHITSVLDIMTKMGEACIQWEDTAVRKIQAEVVVMDELWSFVGGKEHTRKEKELPPESDFGDRWLYVAMDHRSKLVIAWEVGRREKATTLRFIEKLHRRLSRVVDRPILVSDGYTGYPPAVRKVFGNKVRFGQVVKKYDSKGNYDGCEPRMIIGDPPDKYIDTNIIEGLNTRLRAHCRRLNRYTVGFSKNTQNHRKAIASVMAYYNFVAGELSDLKLTPAQSAMVSANKLTIRNMRAVCRNFGASGHGQWHGGTQADFV